MGKLTNQSVLQKITARFGDKVSIPLEPFGLLSFETKRENIT
ncbi:MAG TPA: NADH-quinone oxidoreductase subunit C, partial [Sphingobacteriaceae bacterium]|nr:NADH-quinone oxidoreductase subunit C [Sphingobacteriaceae bacterium]